ncbi:Transmembrane prolyl 4-hydroxylase [Stylophora pistillata]|uniref:Transmembrane prolyl 4-hydroxylase n=1 Tax=Stylophora pistillata TaxID=50429 RepID=A0A2B4SS66_STYPI|nr:Transmembrane prolyl 4-hydroxylase [Stylophora pistillata]
MLPRECIKSGKYLQHQKTAVFQTKTRPHKWKREIPNFLTKEECQHIIQKAKETGLELSEVESPEEQDKFASSCYDDDYRCVRWAKYGECEKNPGYMLKNCQQSCEVCEDGRVLDFDDLDHDEDGILTGYEVFRFECHTVWFRKSCRNCGCEDLAANCSSLEKEGKCLHPNHAKWMLRNCRRTCKVCLGAVSYDMYRRMDANDIFKFMKTMARKHPRHRSRYSHTAWLHSTIPDPIQNNIIDRVVKLTQLPREIVEGAESLQVVKYDKYGHYHAHYDSSGTGDDSMICCHQTRNKTLPCRICRLVTILYYLNDVEEGGETAFIMADNSTLNQSFPNLESTIVKNKKFNRPCFDEDQDLTQCSAFNELCEKDGINGFKLVRLQGKRTGHVRWLELEEARSYKLITRAMKPLLFEIPHFLTDDECDHVISLAQEAGLSTSQVALKFDEKDLNEVLKQVGKITTNYLSEGNIKKVISYMSFLRSTSPRHKFRYSEQAWLRQDKTADHILRRLHERISRLTKLPRKLLQGSESMQVVRYQASGHYHAHFDSGMDPSVPCCHQNVDLKPPQCRLCRFATILYYLNDVEQGGETAFPLADNSTITFKELPNPESDEFNLSISCHTANFVIPPRKGTALMWYNNFIDPDSGLLGDLDVNSIHGGCDVIEGEKWIANNWLTAPTKDSRHSKSAYDVGFD